MRDRIRQAIADAFARPVSDVPEDASPDSMPDWDSLRHLELMLALELEFGVQISSEAMPELLSVDAIEEYLTAQGISSAA